MRVRSSALASTKERAACCEAGSAAERCLPTVSMARLMSEMVTRTEGLLLRTWAVWRRRKAMSPVPPAMSRMCCGPRGSGPGVSGEKPGLSEATKWSLRQRTREVNNLVTCIGIRSSRENTHFHTRCQPNDIKSFMRSYDSATLVKTPATRSRFSLSVTVSKPKWVGLDGLGIAYSGVEGFEVGDGRVLENGRVNRICCSGCAATPRKEGSTLLRACRAVMAADGTGCRLRRRNLATKSEGVAIS